MATTNIASFGLVNDFQPLPSLRPFRFMSLPFDLRVPIYRQLLVSFEHVPPCTTAQDLMHVRMPGKVPRISGAFRIAPGLAILLANRATYLEAVRVLYGANTFLFDDIPHELTCVHGMLPDVHCECSGVCDLLVMKDWLWTIGKRNRLLVKHIALEFYDPGSIGTTQARSRSKPLVSALKLLNFGHNLVSLEFFLLPEFKDRWYWEMLKPHDGGKSPFLTELLKIRGLSKAEFSPAPEHTIARKLIGEVREELCSEKSEDVEMEDQDLWTDVK